MLPINKNKRLHRNVRGNTLGGIVRFALIILLALPNTSFAVTAGQVGTILQRNNCFYCHGQGSNNGDLQSLQTDDQWSASRFVVPGDTDSSPLINRLINYGKPNISNMPKGGVALSSTDYNDLMAYVNSLKTSNNTGGGGSTTVIDSDTETEADIGMDLNSVTGQKIIFKRCYEQMVREPLDLNSNLYQAVSNGVTKGADACLALFRQAKLTQSGNKRFYDTGVAQKIFSTFYDFNVSWFGARDLGAAVGTDGNRQDAIQDPNQPAYYLMKALFGQNVPYSYVLTANESLKAIRETSERYVSDIQFRYPKSQYITKGQIKGIDAHYKETVGFEVGPLRQQSRMSGSFNVFEHFGAGLLGSQSYIMLNAGSRLPYRTDGGLHTMRTLTKNFFDQVLCRELPVVRLDDAIENVAAAESPLPFRNGLACMQCHSTIDPFAWAMRDIYSTVSDGDTYGRNKMNMRNLYVSKFRGSPIADGPVTEWPDDSPRDFYKHTPWGKLYYRSFDGTLVDQQVNGLGQLGITLANQDAPYVCAAKRYFKFFTGVDANVGDVDYILSEVQLSTKERYYRNFVIKLGKELRNHQSLETMIGRIFASKAYLAPGLGVE